MPVRIYEIAKKLGISSKDVIAQAECFGIANAKVPSSSLDKITAEYLEEKIIAKQSVPSKSDRVIEESESESESEDIVIVKTSEETEEMQLQKTKVDPDHDHEIGTKIDSEIDTKIDHEIGTKIDSEVDHDSEIENEVDDEVDETLIEENEVEPSIETSEEDEMEVDFEDEMEPPEKPGLGDKIGSIVLKKGMHRPRPERRRIRKGRRVSKKSSGKSEAKEKVKAPPKPKYVASPDAKPIILKQPIHLRDLALALGKKPFQLCAELMEFNVFANVSQTIDEFIAKQVCAKHGFRFEIERREKGAGVTRQSDEVALDLDDDETQLISRPPVVTIMGHVDHGKTTLLDVIRKSNVVSGEAGGITQHIGAYTIHFPHPDRPSELQQITFLDTPGHAAFSAMRARGANVTDLVILVVAANDGVKPQTIEALNHARAARVPMIVAVNKIDLPGADPILPRRQLQDHGLICEEWGGETLFVDVSALDMKGIDKLLEMVLLQSEFLELRANPNRAAVGNVIESGMQQGGPIATMLVRKGTLKVGDALLCGPHWGRVKALINEDGKRLKKAAPSVAVRVLGLDGVPDAGLEFNVLPNEKQARKLASNRIEEMRRQVAERRESITLENLFDTLSTDSVKTLNVVIKADTQGSVEAIVDSLGKIASKKVRLEIIHNGVGALTESDIMLASASGAVVIGFHTRLDAGVSEISKRERVQIKLYSIIYELIDEVREAMTGLLDPLTKDNVIGKAEIRRVFELSRGGKIAGCIVSQGKFERGRVRVYRKGDMIYEGLTQSLRRFQDEVNEVRSGLECGIRLDHFNDFQEGDTIESYALEQVAQEL